MVMISLRASTVEPPNKGYIGDNINSDVLSFIERLSSFRASKCAKSMGHVIFGTPNGILCREVYYSVPILEGPCTIRGSTVVETLAKQVPL